MRHFTGSFVLVLSCCIACSPLPAIAQAGHIEIAAGTPEDRDLQAITAEQDSGKKISMYEDFVQKYSSNPAAVAYGNWQLSQAYQAAGDLQKALDSGDKAVAAAPQNLDILVSQGSVAQQMKNNAKLMDYVAKGGAVCGSVGKGAKPDGMSDEDFARQASEEKSANQNSCNFFESSGFNAIASETEAKSRMAYIEKYTAAFPDSIYQDQVSSYAMYTLGPGQFRRKDAGRESKFAASAIAAGELLFGRCQGRQPGQSDCLLAKGDCSGKARRRRC